MVEDNVRTVFFMREQDAEDLYRCKDNGRVYVRQRCDDTHVRWLTANKWMGGYEASCPMKEGLIIRCVDKNGMVLFEEKLIREEGYSDTVAVKKCGFADEEIQKIGQSVCNSIELRDYYEWKSWMMKAARDHKYTGYSENWLYAEAEYSNLRTLFHFEYLGKKAYATVETAKHKISGQTWQCVEIRDRSRQDVLYLCGYIFEEKAA